MLTIHVRNHTHKQFIRQIILWDSRKSVTILHRSSKANSKVNSHALSVTKVTARRVSFMFEGTEDAGRRPRVAGGDQDPMQITLLCNKS